MANIIPNISVDESFHIECEQQLEKAETSITMLKKEISHLDFKLAQATQLKVELMNLLYPLATSMYNHSNESQRKKIERFEETRKLCESGIKVKVALTQLFGYTSAYLYAGYYAYVSEVQKLVSIKENTESMRNKINELQKKIVETKEVPKEEMDAATKEIKLGEGRFVLPEVSRDETKEFVTDFDD